MARGRIERVRLVPVSQEALEQLRKLLKDVEREAGARGVKGATGIKKHRREAGARN